MLFIQLSTLPYRTVHPFVRNLDVLYVFYGAKSLRDTYTQQFPNHGRGGGTLRFPDITLDISVIVFPVH